METLQTLHIVYKIAMIASILYILMRLGIAEMLDTLIGLLPRKYKRIVETIVWPGLGVFIIGALLAGAVKFIIDMF